MKKITNFYRILVLNVLLLFIFLTFNFQTKVYGEKIRWPEFTPVEINGFYEMRAGCRIQKDIYEKDISVMEARLQAEFFTCNDWVDFKYKGDVWADRITEKGYYDTREIWIFSRPTEFLDIKIGRQILTWGTGDLVFLNDLFPKDWQSFFMGRDIEYLKAPSDAVKLSFFNSLFNLDLIYTPKFDSDRYITGQYISYWNENQKSLAGQNLIVHSDKPDKWFQDDEIAVRIYKNINNYEIALYWYQGFWKRPAGKSDSGISIFPDINVYGTSIRGQIGSGIGNLEFAWYQSCDDETGLDPLVDNSEIRYLAGYTQEIKKDFNGSLQYYVEQLLDYKNYKKSLSSSTARDHYRHVITLELNKLLMNQNLKLSLSGYYSPNDEDAYIRPNIHYVYSDKLTFETGANIFWGTNEYTFFAQFEKNTNIYTAVKYSF